MASAKRKARRPPVTQELLKMFPRYSPTKGSNSMRRRWALRVLNSRPAGMQLSGQISVPFDSDFSAAALSGCFFSDEAEKLWNGQKRLMIKVRTARIRRSTFTPFPFLDSIPKSKYLNSKQYQMIQIQMFKKGNKNKVLSL